jgi:hypothetical protein
MKAKKQARRMNLSYSLKVCFQALTMVPFKTGKEVRELRVKQAAYARSCKSAKRANADKA